MRRALAREGAPADLLQCLERPSIPAAQYLMTQADLVQATGGRDMVKAAYSSGTPAFGVGAGNSTMVIDETADIAEAARNTRLSKTSDFGSGCSADGNLVVEDDDLRGAARPASWRRAARHQPGGDRAAAGGRCGTTRASARRTRSRSRPRPSPAKAGFDGLRRSALLPRRADGDRRATTRSARRSSASSCRCSATRASTTRSRRSRPSTRSAARATRAASTRSTTSTSTASPGWRR